MAALGPSREASPRAHSDRFEPGLAAAVATPRAKSATVGALKLRKEALLARIERQIALIDECLTTQLNAILHHREFTALEASWRGLAYLCACPRADDNVRVRVLNVSWQELAQDFDRAAEFDQSALFQKIYSNEFGMPGGLPFGILLCDYEVRHRMHAGHSVDDISLLGSLSEVAAAAFVPAILAAAPDLLGLESFRELDHLPSLEGLFLGPQYGRYNRLRLREDSRFIGLVLPRVLMRRPYSQDGLRNLPFRYREDLHGLSADELCWGNAVYAFGEVVIRAFSLHGWFADICGASRDEIDHGLITGISAPSAETDGRGLVERFPSELALPGHIEHDLSELGFIPVNVCKDTGYLILRSSGSIQSVPTREQSIAAINARLSSMLRYILCVSRFAHYAKVKIRDRIGGYVNAEECEQDLQQWIHGFCLGDDDASNEMKARFPLRDATVAVRPVPGRPGTLTCVLHLRPHFQLDQIFTTFKLVTDVTLATKQQSS